MQIASILALSGLIMSLFAIGISVYQRAQNKKRISEIRKMIVSLNANSSILRKAVFEGEGDRNLLKAQTDSSHLEELLRITRENEAWWRKFNTEKINSLERTVDLYIRGIDYDEIEQERMAANGGNFGQLIEFKKKDEK